MKSKIKSFEDACKLTGDSPILPEGLPSDVINYMKLRIINKALNMEDGEPWEPDWHDHNQPKYYPWFWMGDEGEKGGVGFSFGAFGYDCDYSLVGSRLCFKTRELAEYAAKQFEDIYKGFYLIQN